jgi:hypothetical protein
MRVTIHVSRNFSEPIAFHKPPMHLQECPKPIYIHAFDSLLNPLATYQDAKGI